MNENNVIEFSDLVLMVRTGVNGALAFSALLLMLVFVSFIIERRKNFFRSVEVQAAATILLLIVGHFLRAFSSWIEFNLVGFNIDPTHWVTWTWIWFLASAILILTGKAFMIVIFSQGRWWRWWALYVGLPACILGPFGLAIWVVLAW
jgi:hypothetical protein